MKRLDVSKLFSYAVAMIIGGFGISMLLGLIPVPADPPIRRVFGVVLILMALYRFVMAKLKSDISRSRNRTFDGMPCFLLFIPFVFSLGLGGCGKNVEEESPTQGRLIVCASESHQALVQEEADEFSQLYPKAQVTVVGATTREAFVRLLSDSLQMVITDRKLNVEEERAVTAAELKLQEIRIAEDALAVVVHSLNTLEIISLENLEDVLSRKVTDWSQLPESGLMGSIALVMTGRNSGAYELLNHHFFRLTKDIVPDFVPASQNEVLDYAAAHPQAIGFVSLACLNNPFRQKAEQDTTAETVRPLAFAGLDSTGQQAVFKLHQANVYWGKYPLHYPVFIYFNTERSELAAGFSSFMSGVQGQKIILNWGLVPATMPVRIVQLS